MNGSHDPILGSEIEARAGVLHRQNVEQVWRWASRLFAALLPIQWLGGIALAWWVSPYTWVGSEKHTHPHVWTAVGFGAVVLLPVWLALRHPTGLLTRHAVAVAQMLVGSVLIHVTGGRIETHFHVFGSLAFLAFYRDWRVVLTGTVLAVSDHFVRGYAWPQSLYGVPSDAEWRWLEHAGWMVFENVCLLMFVKQNVREMAAGAKREAKLERANEMIEQAVRERTDELHVSERRSRLLLESIPHKVWMTDPDGSTTYLNHRGTEFLGLSEGQVHGWGWVSAIHPDDADRSRSSWQSAVRSGEHYHSEYRLRGADGVYRWHLAQGVPLWGTNGRIDGWVGTWTDIDHRKLGESIVRASETRYRVLFEANPHPMWVFAPTTYHFLAVNDAAIIHYGFTRDQFLHMTLADLEPTAPGESADPVEFAPIPGRMGQTRTHRRAGGDVRQMELAAHPIEFDGQNAVLVLAIDVTERKVMEEQLKQAQKLESIGQLAAGIAHEINTPIQYIGDNTNFLGEVLRDLSTVLAAYRLASHDPAALPAAEAAAQAADIEYLLAEAPQALSQTRDGVKQVARIVKAMKEFAHPGTTDKVAVDLNKALETVTTVARNEWKYVADLHTRFDPNLPAVRALPGELNQVFLNLLVNAAHAVKAVGGKGTITITTRKLGNMAEVLIADSGCGIPEDVRRRVFDPFFTTKPVGQGTGQGLAIAHTVVVKQHGGAITFESEVGKGTTFIVRLPVDGGQLTQSERIPMTDRFRSLPKREVSV